VRKSCQRWPSGRLANGHRTSDVPAQLTRRRTSSPAPLPGGTGGSPISPGKRTRRSLRARVMVEARRGTSHLSDRGRTPPPPRHRSVPLLRGMPSRARRRRWPLVWSVRTCRFRLSGRISPSYASRVDGRCLQPLGRRVLSGGNAADLDEVPRYVPAEEALGLASVVGGVDGHGSYQAVEARGQRRAG
jgi:hypothetical protein